MTSAHRSPADELATSVWLVKTPEGDDAVIVSFVDKDSEDPVGIFMYEPGVDPVELEAVGMSGVATEFEHATVTTSCQVRWSGATQTTVEDTDYPGDVMVTSARRDADVANAVEAHGELVSSYADVSSGLASLLARVQTMHEVDHEGTFRFCRNIVCAKAFELRAYEA
jgi:hypothetical protein